MKRAEEIDTDIVQNIKSLIRRGEAKAACKYIGIPDDNVHFLDMLFYETGTIEKNPIGIADIEIILKLITPLNLTKYTLQVIFQILMGLTEFVWMRFLSP